MPVGEEPPVPEVNFEPVPTRFRVLIVDDMIALEQTTPTGVFVTFWDPEGALAMAETLNGAAGSIARPKLLTLPEGLLIPGRNQ